MLFTVVRYKVIAGACKPMLREYINTALHAVVFVQNVPAITVIPIILFIIS